MMFDEFILVICSPILLGVLGLVLRDRYVSWVVSRDMRRRLLSDREKFRSLALELIEKRRELDVMLNDPDVSRAGLYSGVVSAIRNNDMVLREVFARGREINAMLSIVEMR